MVIEIAVTAFFVLALLWLRAWLARRAEIAEAIRRHPAGSICPDCGVEVDDWMKHRRERHSG